MDVVVCQPTHSEMPWSEGEGSTQMRCDTCRVLLDICTLLKESVRLKSSRIWLIVIDVVPEAVNSID